MPPATPPDPGRLARVLEMMRATLAELDALTTTTPTNGQLRRVRGEARRLLLSRCYLAAELLALAVVAAAGVAWWSRREPPTITEGSVLVLACVELGAVVAYQNPVLGWSVAQVFGVVAYATLTALHLGEKWVPSRPRSSR